LSFLKLSILKDEGKNDNAIERTDSCKQEKEARAGKQAHIGHKHAKEEKRFYTNFATPQRACLILDWL